MRPLFITPLVVVVCFRLAAGTAIGQDAPPAPRNAPAPAPAAANGNDEVSVQYPNNPVSDILVLYEKLTKKILVRDASLATAPNLSIIASKKLSTAEAIHLIEASLLLNGFTTVPDGENRVKVLFSSAQAAAGKNPRSEGVPLYDNPTAIPPGNEVVSYFMQLRFIASSEALSIFKDHVVLHSYGQIIDVPNAQAIVITENAPLIRELIDLQQLVDVPPVRVDSEFITLKRADAERVAETITKLIESEKTEAQRHGAAAQGGNAVQGGAQAGGATLPSENGLVSGSVQLVPDARTNRILVITRRENFPYIKNLIEEFDEEIGSTAPMDRPLKYITASEVLQTLGELLQEGGQGGQPGQPGQPPGIGGQTGAESSNQQQQGQGNQNLGQNGQQGGNGGPSEPQDILKEPDDKGPTSLLVGKTHLIADNKANSILVIGPPESQAKVSAILDKLDKRPPQVYLSTVIGQLTLKKDNEEGIDYAKLFSSASGAGVNQNGFAISGLNTTTSLIDPKSLITAAAFPATGGLSLYGTIGKNLSIYVHALESTNRFKVLSRPVVYTANNKKAVILSGQKVPFPSSTISDVTNTGSNSTALQSNIDYEDVVLKLEVIPLINANNEVNLKIAQVDDSIAGTTTISGNTVPTISTQKIITTVTVPDGDTVVLGGLITESTTNNVTGIPILMHLPWIGPAFRDTVKSSERDELIIFIQPTVVQTDEQLVDASMGEKNRADVGKDAYIFSQPATLPQGQVDSIFPKDSKGLDK